MNRSSIIKTIIRRCSDLHHNKAPYTVPDFRVFDSIENCPRLIKLRDALAAKGLCDPWIRNEVWRLDTRNFGTERQRFFKLFRGIQYGLILAIISALFTEYSKRSDEHHVVEHKENSDESICDENVNRSIIPDHGKYTVPSDGDECPPP
ncbi:NADH dehydrogenase [ubiquinone] 1 beta subcomplex subunit 3-like [Chrysoperla carnea]|uniref:NADH dehydrogenase [ubiquinone] 1 beta subcomplex subunit 3-like n=1 Tax=Chrysoperla carnea TaxID=189513 RepID=UPI001D06B857|nr:NADH dehydrogenase [ubiquinone] 1 beta subcomplex subunit 3-like [Chrysoperla carnea]